MALALGMNKYNDVQTFAVVFASFVVLSLAILYLEVVRPSLSERIKKTLLSTVIQGHRCTKCPL